MLHWDVWCIVDCGLLLFLQENLVVDGLVSHRLPVVEGVRFSTQRSRRLVPEKIEAN